MKREASGRHWLVRGNESERTNRARARVPLYGHRSWLCPLLLSISHHFLRNTMNQHDPSFIHSAPSLFRHFLSIIQCENKREKRSVDSNMGCSSLYLPSATSNYPEYYLHTHTALLSGVNTTTHHRWKKQLLGWQILTRSSTVVLCQTGKGDDDTLENMYNNKLFPLFFFQLKNEGGNVTCFVALTFYKKLI